MIANIEDMITLMKILLGICFVVFLLFAVVSVINRRKKRKAEAKMLFEQGNEYEVLYGKWLMKHKGYKSYEKMMEELLNVEYHKEFMEHYEKYKEKKENEKKNTNLHSLHCNKYYICNSIISDRKFYRSNI